MCEYCEGGESGRDRADEMVGPVSPSLMRKFPNETGA